MADHDSLYHRLFDHPYLVAELLREFLVDVPLDALDLDGMTRENARFHAGAGVRRDGDMIWRIPHRDGGETYLLLLLEFQSTSDRWMALRVLVYAGLLWQRLVKEKRLPPDGRLPPILPVVLYDGDRPWAAPLALQDLIGLPGSSTLWVRPVFVEMLGAMLAPGRRCRYRGAGGVGPACARRCPSRGRPGLISPPRPARGALGPAAPTMPERNTRVGFDFLGALAFSGTARPRERRATVLPPADR